MSKYSQVVVLAEDKRHESLLRRYLQRLKYSNSRITLRSAPAGCGAADQWVQSNYPKEVTELRRRRGHIRCALIVMIDGDKFGLDHRLASLKSLAPLQPGDQVSHLVPTWCVETWILCLNGDSVDETTDKRYKTDNASVKPAATQLYEWTRKNAQIPERCVPSLRHGIAQLRGFEESSRNP